MKSNLLRKITQFRAYQLGGPGSSFSYYDGTTFTLMEARLTTLSAPRIVEEVQSCAKSGADVLHITSWDTDHCQPAELSEILRYLSPSRIEYPGYPCKSDAAEECLAMIRRYQRDKRARGILTQIQPIDPPYVKALEPASALGYRDIFYHPKYLSENANDNSTIKLFRTGCFNVASLGDVEDCTIGAGLSSCRIFKSEIDAMLLAHHGADNGFTTSRFLKTVRPTLAICTSDFGNQYGHPKENVCGLLDKYGIPLFTTKTGDVLLRSLPPHTHAYQLTNLKADSTEESSVRVFTSKKWAKLRHNLDTVRALYRRKWTPFPR